MMVWKALGERIACEIQLVGFHREQRSG
jgi:hypothetical protein